LRIKEQETHLTLHEHDDDDDHFIHTYTLQHISALKEPSSGSTYTFCEQGQQNTCPDVNITLKRRMVGQIQVSTLFDRSLQIWGEIS
jgi:hypothetical protein